MTSKTSKSLNSSWPVPVQKAILEARKELMAEAWEEGHTVGMLDTLSAEAGKKVEPTPNPYRSES